MSEENKRVRVFVPPSFEGVSSVAVLEEIIDDSIPIETIYTNHLDFREYDKFDDTEVIIILGLPYKGYALPDDFYTMVNVPFMDFFHFATYGEEIEGEHIVSLVDPDSDPIANLYSFLKSFTHSTILKSHLNFTDKATHLVEAINAYRTWSWENNSITRMLLALYYASYKRLPKLLRGLDLSDIVKNYAPVIKGQMEKMEDYIENKKQMAKIYPLEFQGEPCKLVVVYAEQYINELANALLHSEKSAQPTIVCVGRTTRSSDMFSIRTDIVNAAQVAYMINEGGGKENVASVFSGVGFAEVMGNAIVTKLSQEQT